MPNDESAYAIDIRHLLDKMVELDKDVGISPITFVVEEGAEFVLECTRCLSRDDDPIGIEKHLVEEATDLLAASLSFAHSLSVNRDILTTVLNEQVTTQVHDTVSAYDSVLFVAIENVSVFDKVVCKLQRHKASMDEVNNALMDIIAAVTIFLATSGLSIPDMLNLVSYKYMRAIGRWYNHGEA